MNNSSQEQTQQETGLTNDDTTETTPPPTPLAVSALTNFSLDSGLPNSKQPIWGSCPGG